MSEYQAQLMAERPRTVDLTSTTDKEIKKGTPSVKPVHIALSNSPVEFDIQSSQVDLMTPPDSPAPQEINSG